MYAPVRRFYERIELLSPTIDFNYETGEIIMTNPNTVGDIYFYHGNMGGTVANQSRFTTFNKIDDNHIQIITKVENIIQNHEILNKYEVPIDGTFKFPEDKTDSAYERYNAVVIYKRNLSRICTYNFNRVPFQGVSYSSNISGNVNKIRYSFITPSIEPLYWEYAPIIPNTNSQTFSQFPRSFPQFGNEASDIIVNWLAIQENYLPVIATQKIGQIKKVDLPVFTYNDSNSQLTLTLGANCSNYTLNTNYYSYGFITTTGAYIFYTINGAEPTISQENIYRTPLSVNSGDVIKAMTVVCMNAQSDIATFIVP